jgi:arylsulfatase A-like enzyme
MDYYRWTINRNGARENCDGRYLTEVWTEEALSFIRRHREEPFFLHLAYNAPHTPLQAPEEDVRPFRETGRFTAEVSTLYGMIRNMDSGVGQILAELDELGLAEDTVVMFTSDNGPAMHGNMKRYNHSFRGGKGNVYEGGIRVPMIVNWPGHLSGGREVSATAHFADWFPTLLNVCEADIPEEIDHDGVDVAGNAVSRPLLAVVKLRTAAEAQFGDTRRGLETGLAQLLQSASPERQPAGGPGEIHERRRSRQLRSRPAGRRRIRQPGGVLRAPQARVRQTAASDRLIAHESAGTL